MKYTTNEEGKRIIVTFNANLPSDKNSPNHNSNTTESILQQRHEGSWIETLWDKMSNFLK